MRIGIPLTANQLTSTMTTNRMAAVAVNPLHETDTYPRCVFLFSECSLTDDVLRTLRELG